MPSYNTQPELSMLDKELKIWEKASQALVRRARFMSGGQTEKVQVETLYLITSAQRKCF